jgi:hypothetical protein
MYCDARWTTILVCLRIHLQQMLAVSTPGSCSGISTSRFIGYRYESIRVVMNRNHVQLPVRYVANFAAFGDFPVSAQHAPPAKESRLDERKTEVASAAVRRARHVPGSSSSFCSTTSLRKHFLRALPANMVDECTSATGTDSSSTDPSQHVLEQGKMLPRSPYTHASSLGCAASRFGRSPSAVSQGQRLGSLSQSTGIIGYPPAIIGILHKEYSRYSLKLSRFPL